MNSVLAKALDKIINIGQDPKEMHDAVQYLARDAVLIEILRNILSDDRALAQVSGLSVRHANGFDKLVIALDRGYQVRLHVWHPTDSPVTRPLENAHNHRWPFATTILTGSYTATTFTPQSGETYIHHRYLRGKKAQDYRTEINGTRSLRVDSVVDYVEGTTYWLDPNVVHRVSPADSRYLVASLLVIAPVKRTHTDVFVPVEAGMNPVGMTRHVPMTPNDVAQSMKALIEALDMAAHRP